MDDYSSTPTMRRKRHGSASPRAVNSQPAEEQELGPWYYVNLFYERIVLPLLAYVFDIFAYANRHFLKPILSIALGFAILYFGIQMASSLLHSKVKSALAPVCMVPGSSYMFSMCAVPAVHQNASFEEFLNVQDNFKDLLEASEETSTLPATIKDSEIAIRDLRILVRHSKLPSRQQMELEFTNFIIMANEVSSHLSGFNTKIGAATDRVISKNHHTMHVLEGLDEKHKSVGSVGRVFNAMTGAFVSPPMSLEQRIFEEYVEVISKNKDEITDLIKAASGLLAMLQNLDERLDTIYSLAVGDDQTISRNQDELFSQLWTKLGGNSVQVKVNAKQLSLLKNISAYRRKALKHVSETLLKLQEIEAELNNLRESIAAPEVLGWRDMPIRFHIDQVNRATESLSLARGVSKNIEYQSHRNRVGNMDSVKSETLEIGAGKDIPVVPVKSKQTSVGS